MFRKVITASVLGLVLAGSVVAIAPANAAVKISNGVLCKTPNKSIKVSGTIYKCTKNPYVNKTKYTWVSKDCLNSAATYTKLFAGYKSLSAALPAALAALDAKIAAEQAKATDAVTRADALDAQILVWRAKITDFTAKKATLLASANPSKYATAIATYTTAIRSLNSAIASNTAASSALHKVGSVITTMQAQRGVTVSSVAEAKAGVAQAFKLRNLICQKGL